MLKKVISIIKQKIMYRICFSNMKFQEKVFSERCYSFVDKECFDCPYFRDNKRRNGG